MPWMKEPLTWVLIVVLTTCLAGVALMLAHHPSASLKLEIAKALLQVGVISVAATALKLLLDGRDRARARRDNEAREVMDLLTRLTTSYNAVRSARRNMRAFGFTFVGGFMSVGQKPAFDLQAYDKCIADINATQLELEAIASQVRSTPHDSPLREPLFQNITAMERYLAELVGEYEVNRRDAKAAAGINPREAGSLWNFVAGPESRYDDDSTRKSRFRVQFLDPYKAAMEAMRDELRRLAKS